MAWFRGGAPRFRPCGAHHGRHLHPPFKALLWNAQISLGSLVWAIVYRWYSFTGGDDGIHGIAVPDLISSGRGSYYFTLIVTAACFYIMHRIIDSSFGSVLQGIRDNPVKE